MAIRQILHFPDPRLRNKATPVEYFGTDLRDLIKDMLETMYAQKGIGLAATQINVHQRVLVIDLSADRSKPVCLVNPVIVGNQGLAETEEGCLSVPGVYEVVERAERITVDALDSEGKHFSLHAEGLLSICIQHEIDHLDGKLFVDYLSRLKRSRIQKKLEKSQRHAL